MSRASDRKAMADAAARPGYALMSVPDVARILGCDADVVHRMVDAGELPGVPVGARMKLDPVVVAVHVLAREDGLTPAEYWARYGDAEVVENARRFYLRVRGLVVA